MRATYFEHELFADRPVLVGVWELDGDYETHGHDFVEVAVIGTGSGWHVTAGGVAPLRMGDVIVLRPGAWHGFAGCSGLIVANCCLSARDPGLSFLYEEPSVRDLLEWSPISSGRQGLAIRRVAGPVAAHAIALIEALEKSPPVNRALLLGGLLSVLGTLIGESPSAGRTEAHPAVSAVIDRLRSEPEKPWKVADLARLAAVDQSYLSRLFQRHVGLPPIEYLARIRVEQAAHLLLRTETSISRVGAAVGWADPTYFARRFRALTGLTPSEYRRRVADRASGAGRDRLSGGSRGRSPRRVGSRRE